MDLNKTYANGQAVSALTGDILTYFFKTGIVKAQGENSDFDGGCARWQDDKFHALQDGKNSTIYFTYILCL